MLGFKTKWEFECIILELAQIEVVLGLGFIVNKDPVMALTISYLP